MSVFWQWIMRIGEMLTTQAARRLQYPASRALTSVRPGQVPSETISLTHLAPDVIALLGGGSVIDTHYTVVVHPLTPFEISQRGFTLADTPESPDMVILTVLGGTEQRYGVDYLILEEGSTGEFRRITWDASVYGTLTDDLQTSLTAGMELQVIMRVQGEEL